MEFAVADVHALDFPDDTFCVAHAHQVLQHVGDPVQALRELGRVVKPGGIVAVRDSDHAAMIWHPRVAGLDDWLELYERVARANGGEPHARRLLMSWAQEAGFTGGTATSSTWTFSTPAERAWWSAMWAGRTTESAYARRAIESGHATPALFESVAGAWREWGEREDAWFAVPRGELLCRV